MSMASGDKPPHNTNKKPRIHRSDDHESANTTKKKHMHHHQHVVQKKPHNKNSTGDKGLSINDLKRRIRDVKRLLTRVESLSPEARIVQERALKGYERDLEQEQARRHRSEMIKKYHFVRFLDRKTATKQLRAAQRQYEKAKQRREEDGKKGDVAATDAKLASLQRKIDVAQINVNYTIYYPLTEKYISLYPQEKNHDGNDGGDNNNINEQAEEAEDDDADDDEDEDMRTSDNGSQHKEAKPPMWDVIKKCMADKTLDLLREGKLNIGFDGKPKSSLDSDPTLTTTTGAAAAVAPATEKKMKKEKDSKRKRKDLEVREPSGEDEESDGGFFEE